MEEQRHDNKLALVLPNETKIIILLDLNVPTASRRWIYSEALNDFYSEIDQPMKFRCRDEPTRSSL